MGMQKTEESPEEQLHTGPTEKIISPSVGISLSNENLGIQMIQLVQRTRDLPLLPVSLQEDSLCLISTRAMVPLNWSSIMPAAQVCALAPSSGASDQAEG